MIIFQLQRLLLNIQIILNLYIHLIKIQPQNVKNQENLLAIL